MGNHDLVSGSLVVLTATSFALLCTILPVFCLHLKPRWSSCACCQGDHAVEHQVLSHLQRRWSHPT
ncbi:hypothetical protein CO675_00075 [Bradyrhizobium sp. C9]|nr:hypothetical protein CO675_00075 [Bradyrhizobium sp. C9]